MYLDSALEYHRAGYKVIPFNITKEGNKIPVCEWKKYRDKQNEDQVRHEFSKRHNAIALLMVGNLETIDLDCYNDDTGYLKDDYFGKIKDHECVPNITVNKTRSGGYHLIYKTENPNGNTKLAKRADSVTLIETRGEGGLIIAPPTKGYSTIKGDILDIKEISDSDKSFLFDTAMSFDKAPSRHKPVPVQHNVHAIQNGRLSVKDDYNNKTQPEEIIALLEEYGWSEISSMRTSERAYLTRPGKRRGVSGDYHFGLNRFKSWSTSTSFDPEWSYSPFGVYCLLQYGDDMSACAKALYREGFGDRYEAEVREEVAVGEEKKVVRVSDKYKISVYDPNKPPPNIDFRFFNLRSQREYPICGLEMLVAIGGLPGARKTTFLKALVGAALTGNPFLNFKVDIDNRKILWFDTEQPEQYFNDVGDDILRMLNTRTKPDRLECISLETVSRVDMASVLVEQIEMRMQEKGEIGMIIIDGIVDMCMDFNSAESSLDTINVLQTVRRKTGAIVFGVLHTTKGNGWLRGHLGTIFKEKADAFLEILKKEDHSEVVANKVRGREEFPSVQFTHRNNLPALYDPETEWMMGRYNKV